MTNKSTEKQNFWNQSGPIKHQALSSNKNWKSNPKKNN